MHNPLAALSVTSLLVETKSPASSGRTGDCSFVDAFVDAAATIDAESQTDGVSPADGVGPLFWPLAPLQQPAFVAATDAGITAVEGCPADADETGETVLSPGIKGRVDVPALDQGVRQVATPIATPSTWVEEGSPFRDIERDLHQDAKNALAVLTGGPDSSPGGVAGASSSRMPAVSDASVLQPPPARPASSPQIGADGQAATEAARRLVDAQGADTVGAMPLSGVDLARIQDSSRTDSDQDVLIADDLGLPEVRPSLPLQETRQPSGAKVPDLALEEAIGRPNPQMRPMDGLDPIGGAALAVRDLLATSLETDGPDLAVDDLSLLSPVPTPIASQESEVRHLLSVSSFWERFFSSPVMPEKAKAVASTSGLVPAGAVPSYVNGSLPILIEASGADMTEVMPDAALPAQTPAQHLNLHQAPLAAPAVEAFARVVTGIVFSEWVEDHSPPSQGGDFQTSLAPTASIRLATGLSSAPPGLLAAPIPQVASQLKGVLVRNSNSMTELALAPEELGRVRVWMEPDSANPDRMVIQISIERPETLELFRRHAGELADAIRTAGYSGADIGFGHDGSKGNPDHGSRSPPAPPSFPFDEAGQIEATRMLPVGASLDLRL